MKLFMLSSLLVAGLGLLILNVWLYRQQVGMLFYPDKDLEATPADWNLSYEDIAITTSDNLKLHGWYLPVAGSKQVVLFFHGNGGNISHRGDSLKIFHHLGLSTLIIDYRGYGKSEGSIREYTSVAAGLNSRAYHRCRFVFLFAAIGRLYMQVN